MILSDIDDHYLRRNAKAHRRDRATEPAGNDDVSAVLHNMAVGIAITIPRGYDWRITEKADLSSMRVTGQGKRYSLRHARENIRLVGKQDNGRVVGNLRKRPVEIVEAPYLAAAPYSAGQER